MTEPQVAKSRIKVIFVEILNFLAALAVIGVAYLIYTNKIPPFFKNLYNYFYIFLLIGIYGLLGEKIALTLGAFILPLVILSSTLLIHLKPEKYPLEEWWDIYSILVICSAILVFMLFYKWEETKKLKLAEASSSVLKARVDPTTASKYVQAQETKSEVEIKLEALEGSKPEKKLRKKEEQTITIDPNETPEQRMEREMKQLRDEYAKKSMKLSTTLLRMKNLAKSLDRDEIFSTIIEIISKGLDADRVQLLLNDEKEGKLFIVQAEGMSSKEIKETVINYEENSIITFLAKGGQSSQQSIVGAIGIKECELDPKLKGLVGQGRLKTIIAAPIFVEGKIFAIINVERMKNPDYTRDDQNLVATCADIAGLVIKNSKLYAATMEDLMSTKKLTEEQLRKNEELKKSLSRIVSPSVAEMILQNPDSLKLGGNKREVTVFFSDIRGFTKMSESRDPSDIVEQLNEYFTKMTDILMEMDGTLDKYVGDELMALFGAPVSRPDDPIRAVLTGLRMLDAVRELHEVWKQQGKPLIEIGIGINTGIVTAGYMGSEKQLSYTVIGDNVNLASRVMSNAKPMQLLITKSTYEKVKDYFDCTALEPIMVKGKSMPIEIFQVNKVKDGVDISQVIGKNVDIINFKVSNSNIKEDHKSIVGLPPNLTEEQKKVNIKIDERVKIIECKNCGTENDSQMKFCKKCGMPVF